MMMRVAIIGPGRVGAALAVGLGHAGHTVAAVNDRPGSVSLDTFRRLAPDATVKPLEQVVEGVDLVVVATPDDAITDVARTAAAAGQIHEGQRWIHLSGGLGTDALSVVAAAGGRVAACHPAMTFPDAETGSANLRGTSWAVTAAEADLGWARVLICDLGGSPFTVAGGDRTLYHAGLAVGSNATTAVVTLARDLLLGAGISDPAAFLGPLVAASAEGAAHDGVTALTGPIRRGDAGTVQRHLVELGTSFPEAVAVYKALGTLILSQAVRAGLDPDRASVLRQVLEGH